MGRVTANSRAGRSLIRVGVEHIPGNIPKEIADHNRQVEEKKLAKKLAALQRREGNNALPN